VGLDLVLPDGHPVVGHVLWQLAQYGHPNPSPLLVGQEREPGLPVDQIPAVQHACYGLPNTVQFRLLQRRDRGLSEGPGTIRTMKNRFGFPRPLLRDQATVVPAPSSLSPPKHSRALALIRVTILAGSLALMLPGAWGHSVTVVEFAHLPAGLAVWQRHSLGIYRVCGPLSKLLYALPAHLAGVRIDYPPTFDSDVDFRPEWALGRIFQSQYLARYHDIYRWSRLLPVVVMLLGGCLICEWSTRLFGAWPGVVSLCQWCWMPPVLALGALVTSDTLAAVMLVLAARSYWAFLLKPRPAAALLAGLMLGMAQSTKYTLLVIYPCWAVLLAARAMQLRSVGTVQTQQGHPSPARLIVLGPAVLVISILVIDALYLFRGVGCRPEQLQPGLSSVFRDLSRLKEQPATAWLLSAPLPIPLEYLRGLDFQLADAERLQSAYLLGWSRPRGWWYWYVVAALIKIPLPALVLFAIVLVGSPRALRGCDPVLWAGACLLLPAAEVALTISATTGTGTNAAFRYLMPSLALLCVWAGRALSTSSKAGRAGVLALLFWLLFNAITALPDHLGWHNEIGWAWSRATGKPPLIGDSLDWGQDLARLSRWVARHSDKGSTLICVYGLGETEPYGLRPPTARTTSDPGDRAAYLAVSEEVLLGDHISNYVGVAGSNSVLSEPQRETLMRCHPVDRIGRTIRIYRLRDVDTETSSGRLPRSNSSAILQPK
jgi:hypothetical protein